MEVYILCCGVCVCVRLCNKISKQGYCQVNHVTSFIVAFIVTICIKRIVIYRVISTCKTTDTSFCSSSVSLNCLLLSVIGQKIGHMILAPPTVHMIPIVVVVLYTENVMVVKRRDLIIEHLISHFTIYVRSSISANILCSVFLCVAVIIN